MAHRFAWPLLLLIAIGLYIGLQGSWSHNNPLSDPASDTTDQATNSISIATQDVEQQTTSNREATLMNEQEAFDGLDPTCPAEIRNRQSIVEVKYWSFDGEIRIGQIIVDKDLVQDIKEVFEIALKHRFPIQSIVPVSHPNFRKDGRWSDDLSMAANNSSGFNYRLITGGNTLSQHALGRAVDINPVQNPYIRSTDQGELILPPGATYDPQTPGTLTADHPITQAFIARGWDWGGNWTRLKDYQHFEKRKNNEE